MTQKERDRLVALKKAKKKLITQKQAAAEIGVSERQVRGMLRSLKERGDKAVVHAAWPEIASEDCRPGSGKRDWNCKPSVVPGLWSDFGSRVSGEETRCGGEPRDTARLDGGSQAMASQSQAGGKGACLAHTAEPLGRIAAMGYERARWAGGPRAEAVFDQHDSTTRPAGCWLVL